MGYRDEMEAARQRVAALERELEHLLPGGSTVPLEVEVVELRRKLLRFEEDLGTERRERELAELAVQELTVARDRLRGLERSLEMVQSELQRRRREHEELWRKAALAEVRGREADELRARLSAALEEGERHARRADLAEVRLIRTQMQLSVERARPEVKDPWPLDAPHAQADRLRGTYAPGALDALSGRELLEALDRLALLIGDLLWNPPEDAREELEDLLQLLRREGHPLLEHDRVRLGPLPVDGPGLRVAMAPLALQVAWTRRSGRRAVVTIAEEEPLRRHLD